MLSHTSSRQIYLAIDWNRFPKITQKNLIGSRKLFEIVIPNEIEMEDQTNRRKIYDGLICKSSVN